MTNITQLGPRELISIITPCFNAEKYLEQTYLTVTNQTHNNGEWIIFDDFSTDSSWQTLKIFSEKDKRIKIFKNTQNSGAAVTRNNCLDKAVGSFIAFLDVDDLWSQDKLSIQIKFMNDKKVNFSHHDYNLVNPDGSLIKAIICPAEVSGKSLLRCNPFATSAVMIRADLINKESIRFRTHLRRRQDYLFWFECLNKNDVSLKCLGSLSEYRVFGSDSLSGDKKKMAMIQWSLYRSEFGLNYIQACYYFIHYAIHGIKKYFIRS